MKQFSNTQRLQDLIDGLDQFNATVGKGTTRLTYSPEFRQAGNYLRSQMEAAGLSVHEDAVGNIIGRLEGQHSDLAPVLVGSHFDSVPNGGKFDGQAGVVAGIEIAFLLNERGLTPKRPIEFIAMIEEEGTRFGGGLLGSRILTGKLDMQQFPTLTDDAGISVAQAMQAYGLESELAHRAIRKAGSVHAFLELHIEQGPVLETHGDDVGIVDCIVGQGQIKVTFRGQAGHAGTTPMKGRRDALTGAIKALSQLPDLALNIGQDAVLTIGKLNVYPGGANVIPDVVTFTADIRAPRQEVVRTLMDRTREVIEQARGNGLSADVEEELFVAPVPLSVELQKRLLHNSDFLGLKSRTIVSGAGHDAMIMADFAPTGLVFVPSRNGISHSPEEWTDYNQLAKGVDVLFLTVCDLVSIDLAA